MPAPTKPYTLPQLSQDAMRQRADDLLAEMNERRSCRFFSDTPIPRDIIERVIAVANTAPSGANRKPWRFVAVDDPKIKHEIRVAAEKEEHESYKHRMPTEWLDALEPIGTDEHKPFLDIAPWIIVMFRVDWEIVGPKKIKSYYPVESCGIAAGMLLTACHMTGLATLTHTPSPMRFLRDILHRPVNEKPFLLIPTGFPAKNCTVPDIPKKPVDQVIQWNR